MEPSWILTGSMIALAPRERGGWPVGDGDGRAVLAVFEGRLPDRRASAPTRMAVSGTSTLIRDAYVASPPRHGEPTSSLGANLVEWLASPPGLWALRTAGTDAPDR